MAFLQELQLAASAGKKQRQQEVDTSSELRVINFRLDMTKELLFDGEVFSAPFFSGSFQMKAYAFSNHNGYEFTEAVRRLC